MSRNTTAPRGVATVDDLAVRSLSVGGTPVNPRASQNPDWFGGQYAYNVTSTPADAAKLAAVLAQKLATYLVEYSVVAKNCLRLAVPSAKAVRTGLINVPTFTSVFPAGVAGVPYWSSVDVTANRPWTGGNAQLGNFGDGTFAAGTTQTINPKYVLQSDALIDELARVMAIGYLDGSLCGLYAQMSSNTPVGSSNSTLATASLTSAISEIVAGGAFVAGMPIFFVLPEQNAIDLNTVALEPFAGYIATDFVTGRRRIYSGGVLAEIFFSEKVAVTSSVNKHGFAFTPAGIGLVTSAVASSSTDPNSATPLTTTAIVSSTAVNNFVASVQYGLAAASGNNFAFQVYLNAAQGLIDNAGGVRVES